MTMTSYRKRSLPHLSTFLACQVDDIVVVVDYSLRKWQVSQGEYEWVFALNPGTAYQEPGRIIYPIAELPEAPQHNPAQRMFPPTPSRPRDSSPPSFPPFPSPLRMPSSIVLYPSQLLSPPFSTPSLPSLPSLLILP